jgi:hypothetical protein
MQMRRTRMYPTRSRSVSVMIGSVATLAVLVISTSAAKERPRRLPKGVEVVRLPDGSHDVTAKVTSSLPTGDQVKQLLPGDRLEEAARILCPQGYDMTMRDGAKSRIVSGSFIATQSANVRCTIGADTTTSPAMDTP